MIASLGEAIIDFTPFERDGRLAGFELNPGGSPYNVALAAARLGYPTSFVGRVSTDLFGRILVERLEAEGVDTSLLLTGPEPTTLAFVAYEGGEARYSFRGENAADALLAPGAIATGDLRRFEAVHLGSISLLREPGASTILGLARALAGGMTLSFDPNVRPGLVADWHAYRALLGEIARLAGLVKVSEDDLELWGEEPAALAASGPGAVVVTRGAEGSRLYRPGLSLDVPALPARVVDTVGAGDAFTAGLLVSLGRRGALARPALAALAEEEWRAALIFASAVASLTCERRGASPPTASEVEQRLAVAGRD
ncbi:Sugar kinases ribokinase family [Gaiella occulta]|uniref:Sugar kinases ribokinase family n=1 Tax=Gaiella occulta TaxID=1002870 RepID=A0A7M2Z074_9ACTN|nr:carbohydrate kinase [Gaiella occulta]RDI75808.1 Sugar kinases ribokinase family [Gaiella occulta]